MLLLARHFAAVYATRNRKPTPEFSPAALAQLRQHPWPGNVRELQHAVERAVILAAGPLLEPRDFPLAQPAEPLAPAPASAPPAEPSQFLEVEKNTILRVIERHNGNLTQAAKELGLTRTALYRRLEKHAI